MKPITAPKTTESPVEDAEAPETGADEGASVGNGVIWCQWAVGCGVVGFKSVGDSRDDGESSSGGTSINAQSSTLSAEMQPSNSIPVFINVHLLFFPETSRLVPLLTKLFSTSPGM
eukprot:CAMPEP_0194040498 /NCGR_PEP_ID=MMETSP0009_2-20130614/12480_1 /TAXON_ID=210454 /ORGANISM="Grammatophora oceanica, Strain CCMP 410" /LENGTH=115 /DNA_ID=CAMNT_0038683655 /DNA_START=73 /DNA_END=417 /DNA_ORIENTATION=-